jgi:hypothetical protein
MVNSSLREVLPQILAVSVKNILLVGELPFTLIIIRD